MLYAGILMLQKAIALIKEFEGFYSEAYRDPRTGNKPITIGYGSTRRADGAEWKLGDRITKLEAETLLVAQLQRDYLPSLTRIPCWQELNSNQQAALLSFAYNLGANFYDNSGFDTISKCLRDRDFANIASVFSLYCNPGSNVEAGLRRRRKAEAKLFLSSDNGEDNPENLKVAFAALPAMPSPPSSTPAVFRTRRQTSLKKLPHSAKELPSHQQIDLPEGIFIKALEIEAVGKHYRLVVATQRVLWAQLGIRGELEIPAGQWYLYGTPLSPDPHVEVYMAPGSAIEILPMTPTKPAIDEQKPRSLTEKLVDYMTAKGYKLFTANNRVNLVGLEGLSVNGTLNDDRPNVFNDSLGVLIFTDGVPKLTLFEGTTEPGSHYTQNRMNPLGAARLQFGQYTAWKIGWHGNGGSGHEALVQVAPVTVCRDNNADYARTGDRLDKGLFGLNIHWGYNLPRENIQRASAGCQNVRDEGDFAAYMRLVKSDAEYQRLKAAGQDFMFTYTLIDASDMLKNS